MPTGNQLSPPDAAPVTPAENASTIPAVDCRDHDAHRTLFAIAKYLGIETKTDCSETVLQIPRDFGTGTIRSFVFQDGISLILYDCTFRAGLQINVCSEQPQPLNFLFCIEGALHHLLNRRDTQYVLKPLLGSITANPRPHDQKLVFGPNVHVKACNLQLDREAYLVKIDCELDRIPERMSSAFQDVKAERPFIYHSNYSVALAGVIKAMYNNDYDGMVRSSYMEAKTLEMLSMQIKQYKDDLDPSSRQVLLRKYDVDKLTKARDILVADLKDAPTIVQLAKLVGINQQKLKSGFKQVFNETINRYLRNERLKRARILLVEGSMSVREIANEVGYSNQSHFASRFKEKYGILPKDYLKTIKTQISDNQSNTEK